MKSPEMGSSENLPEQEFNLPDEVQWEEVKSLLAEGSEMKKFNEFESGDQRYHFVFIKKSQEGEEIKYFATEKPYPDPIKGAPFTPPSKEG